MCLSVPARIEEIEGDTALVQMGGVKYRANVSLIEAPKVGNFVLIHAGFAIQKIDVEEAEKTLSLFEEMGVLAPPGTQRDETNRRVPRPPENQPLG